MIFTAYRGESHIIYVYMCVCGVRYTCEHSCLQNPEDSVKSLEAGVTDDCELTHTERVNLELEA